MGIVSTILFGSWFYLSGHTAYSITAFSLTGSLVAFLYFNKYPAKIFMGDTGSLLIGLISSILAIHFIEVNRNYEGNPSYQLFSVPAVAISVLIIPLFDTVQVFTRRILKGRSPFSPVKTHLHYMLSSLRIKPNYICLSLASINLTVFVGAMAFQEKIAEIIVLSILSIMLLLLLIVIKFSNSELKRD
jgi:UDP-GlcNAc:undecaprenyl-phosphate/decaprenyl-phosphate GlcNAc-1-phosphate transferase